VGWYQWLQMGFTCFAVAAAARVLHTTFVRWAWEPASTGRAIASLSAAGDLGGGLGRLGAALGDSVAGLVTRAFASGLAGGAGPAEGEALMELEIVLARHIGWLQGLARLSLLSGFLGATVEVMWLFAGARGLDGLVKGLAERHAIERGAFSITLGVAAVLFLGYANRMAVLETRRHRREGGKLAMELRRAAEATMNPSSTQ
jgi:hypothetical protein